MVDLLRLRARSILGEALHLGAKRLALALQIELGKPFAETCAMLACGLGFEGWRELSRAALRARAYDIDERFVPLLKAGHDERLVTRLAESFGDSAAKVSRVLNAYRSGRIAA